MSWEVEQPFATISPLVGRKRRASLEGLTPLDEGPEGAAAPIEAGPRKRKAFRGLALDIAIKPSSKNPRLILSKQEGTENHSFTV